MELLAPATSAARLPADKLRALLGQLGTHRTEAQHAAYLANHARLERAMTAKGAA